MRTKSSWKTMLAMKIVLLTKWTATYGVYAAADSTKNPEIRWKIGSKYSDVGKKKKMFSSLLSYCNVEINQVDKKFLVVSICIAPIKVT